MKQIVLILVSLMLCVTVTAQRKHKDKQQEVEVVEVEGRYRVMQTEELSESYCKREALEQARLHAIERRFGSYLSSSSVMLTSLGNNGTSDNYSHYNTIDVRGIWMGDVDSNVTKVVTDEGMTIWEAWVKGRARQRSTTHIDYDVHLLVNGTTLRHESNEMFDQDHFCISFKSPLNGYVMVFATDGDLVYKFVPSMEDGETMPVEAGKDYLFPNETYFTAEIAEGKQMEYYKLIVLFSKNELVPPNFSPSKRNAYEDESLTATIVPLTEMKYKDFCRYYEQQLSRDINLEPRMIELVMKRRN